MGRHGRLARKGIILATAAAGIFIGNLVGNFIYHDILFPEPVKIVKKNPRPGGRGRYGMEPLQPGGHQ